MVLLADMQRPRLQASQPSPFAWVREDGTEIYVPAAGSAEIPDMEIEPPPEDPADEESDYHQAVYTWSSPVTSDSPASL